jgi:hypothetical protein
MWLSWDSYNNFGIAKIFVVISALEQEENAYIFKGLTIYLNLFA